MAETFTWCAENGATGDVVFRRLAAQFGDGYRQVADDGINNEVQSWPLTFAARKEAEARAIVGFFRRHKGARAFRWTPPLGEEGWYEVVGFKPTPTGAGTYSITATFEQVFKP